MTTSTKDELASEATTFTKDELYSAFISARMALDAKVSGTLKALVRFNVTMVVEDSDPASPPCVVLRLGGVEIFRWEFLLVGEPEDCRLSLGKRRRAYASAESTYDEYDDCEDVPSLTAFIEAVFSEALSGVIKLQEEPEAQLTLPQELAPYLERLRGLPKGPRSKKVIAEMRQVLEQRDSEIVSADGEVDPLVVVAMVLSGAEGDLSLRYWRDEFVVQLGGELALPADDVATAVANYHLARDRFIGAMESAVGQMVTHLSNARHILTPRAGRRKKPRPIRVLMD